ncbi:MAG: YodL domain-containing protein [Lachnospiraceae bacterium]|nr:YodL domain-containing protein [Lachnospiraceae bacterium]
MRRNQEQELRAELVRVQAQGGEMNFQYADRLDFDRIAYWFKLEIDTAYGRIYQYCFACKSLADLENAITWVVSDTRFYEATAFVKNRPYVTFRSQQDIEWTFDSYYRDFYRFSEDIREPYPELVEDIYTSEQMEEIYQAKIDRKEYADFHDWLQDMCRSGFVYQCRNRPIEKAVSPAVKSSSVKGEEFLLKGNADCFAIYQIDRDSAGRDYRFFGMKYLDKQGLKPNGADYNLVYAASFSEKETRSGTEMLEDIYVRFNADLPEDYEGHSLSVSDVVLVNQNGKASAWYVDSIGFKELPEFIRERQTVVDFSRTEGQKMMSTVVAPKLPQEKREQPKPHRGR